MPNEQPGAQDKKRFPRLVWECTLLFSQGRVPLRLHTENVGTSGIRVVLEREVAISTPVKVELYFTGGGSISCSGYVVWVLKRTNLHDSTNILYDTGIQFEHVPEESKRMLQHRIEIETSFSSKPL